MRRVFALLLVLAACSDSGRAVRPSPSTTTSTTAATTTTTEPPPPEVLAAGDIAVCGSPGAEQTAKVVEAHPDAVVAAVGDLAYERGTAAEFRDCYGPTWARFKSRTHPAAGNHEYGRGQARDYFAYWGAAAGGAGKGWYSYDVGAWHVVVLNSNCGLVGCDPSSEQGKWLAADLAAHPTACALAYWHHPRWSSGLHGSQEQVDPLWRAAAAGGVDVVVNGHDHIYERFAVIDGMREFVAGTGGAPQYPILVVEQGSEVRHTGTPGLLSLKLRPTSYEWAFLAADGSGFTDTGTGVCQSSGK